MTSSNVSALNQAVQETQEWLKALAQNSSTFQNEEQAYTALRAVLHSLRDRLTVEEAVHFSSQLPTLVRGFYFEGWRPALAPNAEQTPDEFYASVQESLRNASQRLSPEQCTRAVFAFLTEKVDPRQLRHVISQLPKQIQQLWPTMGEQLRERTV